MVGPSSTAPAGAFAPTVTPPFVGNVTRNQTCCKREALRTNSRARVHRGTLRRHTWPSMTEPERDLPSGAATRVLQRVRAAADPRAAVEAFGSSIYAPT